MKVCTDACLFGAYLANELQLVHVNNILDIGTGTGLLSLMLAQKTNALIDAVEIDSAAFEQAKENFSLSPWKGRINIFHADISKLEMGKKYSHIISNPPFFEDDLRSADQKKNFAKHDSSLTLENLLVVIDKHLTDDGSFAVLLPFHRSGYFETAAAKLHFNLAQKIFVKQTPKHNYFRSISVFSKKETTTRTEDIIIKNEEGNYSVSFTSLLKDYYLYL